MEGNRTRKGPEKRQKEKEREGREEEIAERVDAGDVEKEWHRILERYFPVHSLSHCVSEKTRKF